MRIRLFALLLGICFWNNVRAQVLAPAASPIDSLAEPATRAVKFRKTATRAGVPLALVGIGFIGLKPDNLVSALKEDFQEQTQEAFPRFKSYGLDDYSRHAPLAVACGLMATGHRGKRTPLAFSLIYVMAHELDGTIVSHLKRETACARPYNPDLRNSFPSSHTSQAFLTATLLHEQYGRRYPWLSVGGYAMATATGAMRVLANQHWATDVLAGGAIGFLSAEAAWHAYPLLMKALPAKVAEKLLLVPTYVPGGAGLILAVQP